MYNNYSDWLDIENEIYQESTLKSKDRNKLKDSDFGIPELRKYPLTDKTHVLQAVRFFNKAEEKYKHELAVRIIRKAKEFDMDYSGWKDVLKYADKIDHRSRNFQESFKDEPMQEALDKLIKANIEYDDSQNWVLKSPDEIFDKQKANCHDTAWYFYKQLKDKYEFVTLVFFITYNIETGECGETHTACYVHGKEGTDPCKWVEYSYEKYRGIHSADNIGEMLGVISDAMEFSKELPITQACISEIEKNKDIHPGMNLDEYVNTIMKDAIPVDIKKLKGMKNNEKG